MYDTENMSAEEKAQLYADYGIAGDFGNHPIVQALIADGHILRSTKWITDSLMCETAYRAMALGDNMFNYNGVLARYIEVDHTTQIVGVEELKWMLNEYGKIQSVTKDKKGNPAFESGKINSQEASVILSNNKELKRLPKLIAINEIPPMYVDSDGNLEVMKSGYNADTGIMVWGDKKPELVLFDEAKDALIDLLKDYKFATPADKSRAMASILTPALKRSSLLDNERVPLFLLAADQSQAGKTLLAQCIHHVYTNARMVMVQPKERSGVGSFSEKLGSALQAAPEFVVLDNFTEALEASASGAFESALTSGIYSVRLPHKGNLDVDISLTNFIMTSNGINLRKDMGNRCCIVNMLKQPDGTDGEEYEFTQWPESGGSLSRYVQGRQSYFLGCVYSVIRKWWLDGKGVRHVKRADHDFTEWAETLAYIVQDLMMLPPMLDGHAAVKRNTGDPANTFLTMLGTEVSNCGKLGRPLLATDLWEICADAGVAVGQLLAEHGDPKGGQRVGTLMRRYFTSNQELGLSGVGDTYEETADGIRYLVTRHSAMQDIGKGPKLSHCYTFTDKAAAAEVVND